MIKSEYRKEEMIINEKRDLLYFSNVEWRLFQRPQSLSVEFAKRGYRVFYIEPMLSLGNIAHHLLTRKSLILPNIPHDNVILLRPRLSCSTFRFGATQRIDKSLFKIWFSNIRTRYAIRSDATVMLNLPYWWRHIIDRGLFPENSIIYDCIDDTRVHSRNKKMLDGMDQAEQVLASEADVCFASANELFKKMKSANPRTYLLPNAVSLEHFISKSAFAPAELASLPRPLVGFVGSLYDHIDFRVFEKIAEILKEGTVVLVGMTNRKDELRRMLTQHKNIYYAGAKRFDEVPAYMKAFDVCLSPFNIDAIGNSVNPLKLYEYSIFGMPIICSRTKEMENFADLVYLYSSYEEIEPALTQALNERTDDAKKHLRVQFARLNSWQARVDQIEQVLGL